MLISVHDARHHRVSISTRADDEEKDEEEGLEVEKRRLCLE